MAYSSSEKAFYQRHYEGAGGLQVAPQASLDAARDAHFLPGKRYHLLLTELKAGHRYGTAAEIGCSDGGSLRFLASQFKFDRVIGLDIAFADGMVEEVGGVQFMQANSNERLPLEDGSVDVYIAMMVIEHLFDPFHAFQEVKRVLSPRGQAFINLPLVTSIKNRLRLLTGKLPVTSVPFERWLVDREWDGNHLHYFSVDAIEQLAALSGLKVTTVAGVGSHHQWKTRLPRLLANELSFVLEHRAA